MAEVQISQMGRIPVTKASGFLSDPLLTHLTRSQAIVTRRASEEVAYEEHSENINRRLSHMLVSRPGRSCLKGVSRFYNRFEII